MKRKKQFDELYPVMNESSDETWFSSHNYLVDEIQIYDKKIDELIAGDTDKIIYLHGRKI